MDIYVGQLPYSVTETELQELFSEFGEIESINLIMDHYSGRPKGFGFINAPWVTAIKLRCPGMVRVDTLSECHNCLKMNVSTL